MGQFKTHSFFRKTPLGKGFKSRGGKTAKMNRHTKYTQTAFKTSKGGQSGKFEFKKPINRPIQTYKKCNEEHSNKFEFGFKENESTFETDNKRTETDSNVIELPLNLPFKPSTTVKTQNLVPNEMVGDMRVTQLKQELAFITDAKKRITDSSQLALVNYQIDSLISQLGCVGYDVEFTDASETDFITTKF